MADITQRLKAAIADRYRIERQLGAGGMATVYAAEDLKHRRLVAIKVLRPELAAALGPERFLREIEVAASLHHPHVLPLYDSGEADGLLYYVMPCVEGESLRQRLGREKQLPLDEALQIAREVADALSYAHSRGVVHRDIKPENILLEGGHALVTDFGIARAISAAGGERITATGLAVGTPAYMSPEQAAGEREVDGRSDVYALGCVLYEMLAGQPPFTGATVDSVLRQHMTVPPPQVTIARPAVPYAVACALERALAKTPADRFPTASRFVEALIRGGETGPSRRSRKAAAVAALTVAGVAATVAGVLLFQRTRGERALDPDLIVVAPFDALGSELEVWREGMMDVLARTLDGAGRLRTAPPSVAARYWRGRPDPASARAFARRSGAQFAVVGSIVPAGPDSVRLVATIVDATRNQTVAEVEVRDERSRMERVTDSATVRLLRGFARVRPVGAFRATPFGATSLPALRAFLRGEQQFRRAAWDSAMAHYQEAVGLDSTLALAWRRMSAVRGCGRLGGAGDDLARIYGLRAGALNHRLPPRDSLLVTADSLFEALFDDLSDPAWFEHRARLFAILEEAVRRYPNDPEVWYELGDARVHWAVPGRTTPQTALEPLARTIALDSAFGPAYLHAPGLALQLGRADVARRYLATYAALGDVDVTTEGMNLVHRLLAQGMPRSPALERAIDSTPAYDLFAAFLTMQAFPDSAETALRIARALAAGPPYGEPWIDDPGFRGLVLALGLAQRGYLREATQAAGWWPPLFASAAVLGGVPAGSAQAALAAWLADPVPETPTSQFVETRISTLPWWMEGRDTATLDRFTARWDSVAAARADQAAVRTVARYAADAGRAYATLARGDTANAVRRFAALPESVCACVFDRVITAQLLARRGRLAEAAALLDRSWPVALLPDVVEAVRRLERARAAEQLGQREAALDNYAYVAAVWRSPDPELQPLAREATEALRRLGAPDLKFPRSAAPPRN
ncbi:MAG TPA: protein kinase [Gemmatimonadales bacterium]|nr:protein kinase [Gemmatimonadales bacterium]